MKDKYKQRITVAVEDDSGSWRTQLLLEKHRATLAEAVAPRPSSRLVLKRLAKVEALLDLPDPELQRLRHHVIRLKQHLTRRG